MSDLQHWIGPHDKQLGPHDVQLGPHDAQLGPHDVQLLDEAQDMNACLLSDRSRSAPKIVFGDQNQQKYSYRGTMNAFDLLRGTSQQSTHPLPHTEIWADEVKWT